MMKSILITLVALTAFSTAAWAEEASSGAKSDDNSPAAFGQATGDWLKMQASNKQGSQNAQEAAPALQERAVKRYEDSFDYRIPEYFYNRNTFSSGGGGTSGTSH